MNDTCLAPVTLMLGAPVSGDTSFAANDLEFKNASCTGAFTAGPDVTYTFTAPTAGNYRFTLLPHGWDGALYILDTCPTSGGHSLSACDVGADQGGVGDAESITLTALAGDTFAVIVDSASSSLFGPFDLSVESVPGDSCANAQGLALSSPGDSVTVSGTTQGFTNDVGGDCGGQFAADVAYALSPTTDVKVTATITAVGDGGLAPVLYLDQECFGVSADLACAASADGGSSATFSIERLRGQPSTPYILWVDGQGLSQGAYSLQVTLSQPGLNDACSSAAALTAGTPISGDTSQAQDDYSFINPVCTGRATDGPDLVYAFVPPANGLYTFTLTPHGWDGALYLLGSCPSSGGHSLTQCLAGSDSASTSGAEFFTTTLTAGATYFVVVDSATSGAFGTFDLGVVQVPGDSCALPATLAIAQAGNTATVNGDLRGSFDDHDGVCGGLGKPDQIFTFTTTQDTSLTVTVTGTLPDGGAWTPVVSLSDGCSASPTELSCATSASGSATLRVNNLPASNGTSYALWVDSADYAGPFTLAATLGSPVTQAAGDSCSSPLTLPLGTTATGNTSTAQDDYDLVAGSCPAGGGAGPDLVYAFTPPSDGRYEFSLSTSGWAGALYALDANTCPNQGSSGLPGCIAGATTDADGGPAVLAMQLQGSATTYLIVDGVTSSAAGAFQLSADYFLGDTCSAPQVLSVANPGDSANLSGDLSIAGNDAVGSCGGYGPDLVYAIAPNAPVSLSAVLTTIAPADGGAGFSSPVLYVTQSCAFSAPDMGCAFKQGASPQTVRLDVDELDPVDGGAYYLWVDSNNSAVGAFNLAVTLASSVLPPAGDLCTNPLVVQLGTPVVGDSTGARADYQNPTCAGLPEPGPDVVYAFTAPDAGFYSAALQPLTPDGGQSWNAAIYVTDSCPAAGSVGACLAGSDSQSAGGEEIARFQAQGGHTYFLFVDGHQSFDQGPFSLQVATYTPPPPPTNDSCSAPIPIAAGTTVSGDTTSATGDYQVNPTCMGDVGMGRDEVFAFTPTVDNTYTITVTPTQPWDPALYVTDTCPAAGSTLSSCLNGADYGFTNDPETLYLSATAGVTYYIFVDSDAQGGAGYGPFELSISP